MSHVIGGSLAIDGLIIAKKELSVLQVIQLRDYVNVINTHGRPKSELGESQ